MNTVGRSSVRRVVRRGKPRRLLSGALVSLVGYLALAVFAAQQQLFALDYGTRAWVQLLRYEALRLPMELVTSLGDDVGLIAMIAIAIPILWRVSRRWALALPVLMAGAGALQWLAKVAAGRARPDQAPWGFPSGHVLSLVVFFGLMIYLIATAARRRRRWRVLASLVAAAPVVVVAFSRLYLDRHWLSDLVGGLTVGAAYLLLAIWLVEVVLTPADDRAGHQGRTREPG
ncbi:MAG: phosphatase PAP2 family protein [Candidatus Rokuibacteriota bacterium]|nr:MAG: phosphatase PAP2 family protein [Candidatus Rokubacteria bacterium]